MLVKQYNSLRNLFVTVLVFRKSPKDQQNTTEHNTRDSNYTVPPDTCTFPVYV